MLRRQGDCELDRGAPYLELSEKTPMDSPYISAQAAGNRALVSDILAENGFVPYPYEFWHYSHGDADYHVVTGRSEPAAYGPVERGPGGREVTPVANLTEPLLTTADIARRLERWHVESTLANVTPPAGRKQDSSAPGPGV